MGFFIRQTINVLNPKSIESDLGEIAHKGDSLAHTWCIEVVKCSPNWIKGSTVTVEFTLPNGTTSTVNATWDGNIISADFPSAVYASAGDVYAKARIRKSTEVTTIAAISFSVVA